MSDHVAETMRFEQQLTHSSTHSAPIPWPVAAVLIGSVSLGLWAILAKTVATLLL